MGWGEDPLLRIRRGVGGIRFDHSQNRCERDVSVSPHLRGPESWQPIPLVLERVLRMRLSCASVV